MLEPMPSMICSIEETVATLSRRRLGQHDAERGK